MGDLTTCHWLKKSDRGQATMETWQRTRLPKEGLENRRNNLSPALTRSKGSSPSGHSSQTQAGVAGRLSLEQKAGEGGAVGGAVPAPAGAGRAL